MTHLLFILIVPLVAVQNQSNMQRTDNQKAATAAQAFYNYVRQRWGMGYTGPIPSRLSEESLNSAVQAAQKAMQSPADWRNCCANRKNWDSITSTREAITRK